MGSRILLGNRLFHSRILLFTLVLNGIVLLLAGRSAALCTLNPTSPSVTICSPANGATVTSPVSLVAGTTDTAYPVTAMKVYVDNVAVYSVKTNQLSTSLSLSAAKHNITVNAWDSSGTVFKGTSIVTVSGGAAPVSVSISPPSGTLIPGQTLQFTSTVLNTSNTAVNWSVDGVAAPGNPTVGMITSSGLYTAGTALGNHTVVATSAADSTKSASATVTVNAPPPVSVTVTPGTASIGVNATQQFTATVQNTTNTGVTWAVDTIAGGNTTVGTITGAGNTVTYTAPATAGPHTVTATSMADNTKSANAAVTVNPPPPVSVTVTPGTVTIGVNATQQFTATVQNTTTTGVTWAVDTIAGGNTTVGTITGAGNTVTYTAPATAGPHTVTATSVADNTKSANAAVTVNPPPPVSVTVTPGTATIGVNATQQFTATVQNTTNTGVTWAVDTIAGGNATVGTITGAGNTVTYTAPATTGPHTVTATSVADTTQSGSATVTVAPVSVALSPGTATLAPNATQQFTATVQNTSNTGVTWVVDTFPGGSAAVGTITGTGNTVTYTAPATAGPHTVTATSMADTTQSANATVTVNAACTAASPAPSVTICTPVAGSSVTSPVNVQAVAASNAPVTKFLVYIDNVITYTASNTISINTNLNLSVGKHKLVAQFYAGAWTLGTETITVVATPPPVSVSLSPTTTNVAINATQPFTATVQNTTNTGVTWTVDTIPGGSATVGTIIGTGDTVIYSPPGTTGSHTVTATSVADTTKSANAAVTVTAPLTVTVAVTPNAPSVAPNATQQFTATVQNTTNTGVTWTVDTISGGDATVGTITGTGNTVTYTAPATTGTHTITATSVADTTQSGNAVVTVTTVPPPFPSSNHVFLLVEENQSFPRVFPSGTATNCASSGMPYLCGLAAANGLALNVYANSHGSLEDYLYMTSGSTWTASPTNCTGSYCASIGVITGDNIAKALTNAGKTWRGYFESMPSQGYIGGDSGQYFVRHNPFPWYSYVVNSVTEEDNMYPFTTQFPLDVTNNTFQNFSFIVPNHLDDADDPATGVTPAALLLKADTWLQTNISPLLSTPPFQPGGDGVLIVVFDEGDVAGESGNTVSDLACSPTTSGCGGHVALVMIGPNVKPASTTSNTYHFQDVLHTIIHLLGMTDYMGGSATASDIALLPGVP